MFIANIKKFLPEYENYKKSEFIKILNWSNKLWFDSYKMEKDFLLTLVLIKIWKTYPDLTFKWWTCLNKIYFPYFRLSEDLDFTLDKTFSRTQRKSLLKEYEENLKSDLNLLWLNLIEKRTKFDEHKMAIFNFGYKSIIDNSIQNIKIEISLKNKLQLKPVNKKINSLYIDKIFEENIFDNHYINCINLQESIAEKVRASLTRKSPAIRDFFDIWYIKNHSDFDFKDFDFLKLVKIKLEEENYNYTANEDNYKKLLKQIETDLKPVLNNKFDFDLESIYNFILNFKV